MNREIKFRGKSSVTDEWIYGSLVKIGNESYIVGFDEVELDGHHISFCSDRPVFTKQETIGQFTRLRDIENKEIYDGDIITVRDIYQKKDYVGCIRGESSTYDYGVYFINHPLKNLWTLNDAFFYYGGNVKVIGNIFDNPELMEK